jgi:hypothetical protein
MKDTLSVNSFPLRFCGKIQLRRVLTAEKGERRGFAEHFFEAGVHC